MNDSLRGRRAYAHTLGMIRSELLIEPGEVFTLSGSSDDLNGIQAGVIRILSMTTTPVKCAFCVKAFITEADVTRHHQGHCQHPVIRRVSGRHALPESAVVNLDAPDPHPNCRCTTTYHG